jgi:hypothetical protein
MATRSTLSCLGRFGSSRAHMRRAPSRSRAIAPRPTPRSEVSVTSLLVEIPSTNTLASRSAGVAASNLRSRTVKVVNRCNPLMPATLVAGISMSLPRACLFRLITTASRHASSGNVHAIGVVKRVRCELRVLADRRVVPSSLRCAHERRGCCTRIRRCITVLTLRAASRPAESPQASVPEAFASRVGCAFRQFVARCPSSWRSARSSSLE